MVMEREIKGIKSVVVADKVRGFYRYLAFADIKPSPISYTGRAKKLDLAVCRGFNTLAVGIRQLEEM